MKEFGRNRFACWILGVGMLLAPAMGASPASADSPDDEIEWSFRPRSSPFDRIVTPSLPDFPIRLLLDDDDLPDGDFGVGGSTAQQFLWFNQFDRPPSLELELEEIWVLFSPGANMAVGAPIQLAVYVDPDSTPTNGATLLGTFDETIRVLDGQTFSVYPLNPPLEIRMPGDILIGVVNRFVASGMTGPTDPAALDTTMSRGRSWVAVWSTDPPPVPSLPPDLFIDTVDVFVAGNWMIRGFGSPLPPINDIPTLSWVGLAVLAALLGVGGSLLSRRQRSAEQRAEPRA